MVISYIMNKIGFIILRHVNDEMTNKYWNHCYKCIRKYYPENEIMIVDDNSNYKYIAEDQPLYKTTVIQSEHHGRGELLPYYYYLRNKLFDTAVILHDSVFINSSIDFNVERYKFIWDFEHYFDQTEIETSMIKVFDDKELLDFYNNKDLWKGCFGGMSIVTHDYLSYINSKYDFGKLLDVIKTRNDRCCFERVIGCLLESNGRETPLLGNIHSYCRWGFSFEEKDNFTHLPIIKVWIGR
jgi:hypothetical protein